MKLYSNVNFGDGVYPGDVVWCQEEPKNMGPWPYTRARLVSTARELCNKDVVFKYAGRRSAASPATGIGSVHTLEQAKLLEDALVA
jgi:2-oxoglutarate dehydrogenase E1 component